MLPDSPVGARPPEPAATPSDELVPSEVAVATPVQQPQFIGTATSPADIPTSPAAGLGAAEMEQHVAERLATNRAELISLRMDALCKRALKEGLPVRPIPHPTSAAPPEGARSASSSATHSAFSPAGRLPAHHLRAAQSEVVEQSVVEASASRSDKSEETRKALVGKLATHMAYRPVPLNHFPLLPLQTVCCRLRVLALTPALPGDQARQAREGGLRRRAVTLQQPLPAPVRAPQTHGALSRIST